MVDVKGVPIGRTEDRTIPGPVGEIAVRVYTPIAAGGAALPCLIYYHGGGFVIGSLDTADATCRTLANEAGVRVISVDYRLAPENKFPAAVEDAIAALRYIEANAMEFDIDPNRIAVGGDSAGGNLAAVVALMARDTGAPKLSYQLLIYPMTDFAAATPSKIEFAKGYVLDEVRPHLVRDPVHPRHRGSAGLPLVALARRNPPRPAAGAGDQPPGHDPLRDEGKMYADKLGEAGVTVTYRDYPGQIHGFMIMSGVIDEGRAGAQGRRRGFEDRARGLNCCPAQDRHTAAFSRRAR